MASEQAAPPPPVSAKQRVFELPELLENILLHAIASDKEGESAGFRSVLLGQRVDKTCRATIQGSQKLQRGLWMMPSDVSSQHEPFHSCNPFLLSSKISTPFKMAEPRLRNLGHIEWVHDFVCSLDKLQTVDGSCWKMYLILPNSSYHRDCHIKVFRTSAAAERQKVVDYDVPYFYPRNENGFTMEQLIEKVWEWVELVEMERSHMSSSRKRAGSGFRRLDKGSG